MASSAFKSTTRRDLHASSSTSRSDPPPCRSRSRSVSAAPRVRGPDTDSLQLQEGYANTRTNPLFDSAASPSASPSPPPGATTSAGGGDVLPKRGRGREPLKGGGRGAGAGRARSVSVAPQRRHTASVPSVDGAGAVGVRRASRPRSVAGDARPYRGSEVSLCFTFHPKILSLEKLPAFHVYGLQNFLCFPFCYTTS